MAKSALEALDELIPDPTTQALNALDSLMPEESTIPAEFGKGIVRGARDLGAGALKGLGALATQAENYSGPISNPAAFAEGVIPEEVTIPSTRPPTPMPSPTEHPIWKAGEAVGALGQQQVGAAKGWEDSWSAELGSGLGSMIGGIGLGMIPGVGLPLAGTTFVLGGSGEAAERAVRKKATPDEAIQAAGLGSLAGATDIVDNLLPIFGSAGKALSFIHRVGIKALKSALIEGGQEGVQQFAQNAIAKGVYDPSQDLMEDVPKNIAVGGILGGFVGGGASALSKEGRNTNNLDLNLPNEPLRITVTPRDPTMGPRSEAPVNDDITEVSSRMRSSASRPAPQAVEEDEPVFYSKLKQVVEDKIPDNANPQQIISTLRNNGVKQDEIEWTGVPQFLAGVDRVSKADLLAHLEENQVRVDEKILGVRPPEVTARLAELKAAREENSRQLGAMREALQTAAPGEEFDRLYNEYLMGPIAQQQNLLYNEEFNLLQKRGNKPQYADYSVPGEKQDYREFLLTLGDPFATEEKNLSSAWEKAQAVRNDPVAYLKAQEEYEQAGIAFDQKEQRLRTVGSKLLDRAKDPYEGPHFDEPNILAHARVSTREDVTGNRTYFIEEIQSDWHQAGRKRGYQGEQEYFVRDPKSGEAYHMEGFPTAQAAENYRQEVIAESTPIVRDILETAVVVASPRMTGIPQAPFKSNWSELAFKRLLRDAADRGFTRIALANPEQVIASVASGASEQVKSGIREFYGKVLPSMMGKYAKKYGMAMGETRIGGYDEGTFEFAGSTLAAPASESNVVKYLEVPPLAASHIKKGFPLFSKPANEAPRVDYVVDSTLSRPLRESTHKIVAVFSDLIERAGITAPVKVALTSRPDMQEFGLADRYADGSYVIILNEAKHANAQALYATAAHEFGHIVFWDKYQKADAFTKLLIREEYNKWRSENVDNTTRIRDLITRRDNAIVNFGSMRGLRDNPGEVFGEMSVEDQKYWGGFEEWFAEQVAKWSTTSEKALKSTDKWYASVGKSIRWIVTQVREKLGLETNADTVMSGWLDSMLDSVAPFAQGINVALDAQTQKENQRALAEAGYPELSAVPRQAETELVASRTTKLFEGKVPKEIEEFYPHLDRINWFYKWSLNLLQMGKMNPHLAAFQRYVELVQMKNLEEQKINDGGVRMQKKLNELPEYGANVMRIVDDVVNMRYRSKEEAANAVGRMPTEAEFGQLVQKHKLNQEEIETFAKLSEQLTTLRDLARQERLTAAQETIKDPAKLADRLDQINAVFDDLTSRPYFPFLHHGRHAIVVRNAAGSVIHFETWDKKGLSSAESRQRRRFEQLEKKINKAEGETVHMHLLKEDAGTMMGLPNALLEAMEESLEVSSEQRMAIRELGMGFAASPQTDPRFENPTLTDPSAMRQSLAKYMFYSARYYTKLKYAGKMRDMVTEVRRQSEFMPDGVKRSKIADYMQDHLNYNMNPKGDWAILRSITAMWYLAFSPATAALNLSQLPLITYPFLASKFGDIKAIAAMNRAGLNLKNTYRGRNYYEGKDADFELKALGEGIKEGIITEAQAAELFAMSEGGNLKGWMGNPVSKMWHYGMEKGMAMFEASEQVNRRVTFRAALQLALRHPNAKYVQDSIKENQLGYDRLLREGWKPHEASAFVTAKAATESTQYVYARYAAPRFMRGKLRTVFIFKNFMQNTMFLISKNPSVGVRYMVLMLLAAGLQGVPGGDDLKKLARAIAWHAFGKDWDADRELRKHIMGFFNGQVPPDLILYGLSRRGFGIPAALDAAGNFAAGVPLADISDEVIKNRFLFGHDTRKLPGDVPFPVLDRNKAVSMGNVLPIELGKLFGPPTQDRDKVVADQVQKAAGSSFGMFFNMYKALMDSELEGNDMKRWERALPRAAASISKAYRAYDEGMERYRKTGAPVLRYDRNDTEQMAEILAIAAGYQPARQSIKWDLNMAKMETIKIIDITRTGLMQQMFQAVQHKSQDEIDTVVGRIRKFNDDLPAEQKSKVITDDSLKKSIQTRTRTYTSQESGIPMKKSDVPIAREIERLYPEAGAVVDVRKVPLRGATAVPQ